MNETYLRELFGRMRNGDREAFECVYQELAKPIYTICYRITQSKETAEDITHDVFVKLYNAPPDASVRNIRAWIFQMARNLAIDGLRKNVKWDGQSSKTHLMDSVERMHLRMDMEAAFAKLSGEEREILALYLNGQLGFREIADIVKLSVPAVYRRYRKALKKIQMELNGG